MDKSKIVGAFEKVIFPEFNQTIMAKVDTGAYRGALHVDTLEYSGDDIFFTIQGEKFKVESDNIKQAYVKSSSGHVSHRPLVKTTVIINGKEYEIWIGLTNRKAMHFPALIGRYFLRTNKLLVDVCKNSELDRDGRIIK